MAYTTNNWNICSSSVFIIFFLKIGMACQKMDEVTFEEVTFEIHTTVKIPCRHDVPLDVIDIVTWTKSSKDECYKNGDLSLVSWDGDRDIRDPNDNYDIDMDFSLVIRDVTTRFIGIYRCAVTPKDTTAESEKDTRLTVFKYPDEPPSITYEIRGDDEINITCTHGPVFPLFHPSFPFPYHHNHTSRNADGTYIVSISAVQQFSGNEITLYCFHSYNGQHRSSFLQVHRSHEQDDPYTTDPPQRKTSRMSNIFPTGVTVPMPEQFTCGSTLDIRVITILILILIVMVIVIILVVLIHRRNKKKRVGTFQDMPLMKTSTESGIGYVITDGENFRILLKVLCNPTLQNNLTAPMVDMVDIGDLSANIDLEADENTMKSYVRVHAERDVLQKY